MPVDLHRKWFGESAVLKWGPLMQKIPLHLWKLPTPYLNSRPWNKPMFPAGSCHWNLGLPSFDSEGKLWEEQKANRHNRKRKICQNKVKIPIKFAWRHANLSRFRISININFVGEEISLAGRSITEWGYLKTSSLQETRKVVSDRAGSRQFHTETHVPACFI